MGKAKERITALMTKENDKRERQIRAKALYDAGYSNAEIAKQLKVSEGTVRNLLREED